MTIGWLDPAIETRNTGDHVISEAIGHELDRLGADMHRLPTRRPWTAAERQAAARCDLLVVGGTNLLASHPVFFRQWCYGLRDAVVLRHRCVLFGVGWWQYQRPPDLTARAMLRSALSQQTVHGARDSYTVRQLARAGIDAVNVTCPTLWRAQLRGQVRSGFQETVVATVTDYMRDPTGDRAMLTTLRDRAQQLVVWPQGSKDSDYVRYLGFGDHLVSSSLNTLDRLLDEPDVEYVGTRLHGGARALSRGVPTVIVEIDNRAAEIAKDVGLWSVRRGDIDRLDVLLDGFDRWELQLPDDAIERWRAGLATTLQGHVDR